MTVEVPQIQFLDDGMVVYCWAWCLVRQWTHGLRQLLGAFGWLLHIFYDMVFSGLDVDAAPSMLQLLPQLVTLGIGHYVHEPLELGSSLFAAWVYSSWRNAWFNSGYMLCVSSWCFWKVLFF